MKLYKITTKSDSVLMQACSRDEAFAKYFAQIIDEEVSLDRLGHIITLHDGSEEYPCRTVPLLFLLGKMDRKRSVANIAFCLDCTPNEAEPLFDQAVKQDQRLLPLIQEIRKLKA